MEARGACGFRRAHPFDEPRRGGRRLSCGSLRLCPWRAWLGGGPTLADGGDARLEQADLELIRRARHGDPQAIETIVRNYQSFVYRTAYGILQNAADAEDATQEAFIRAFRSLGRLREDRTFPTWLARIAVRISLDMVQAKARRAQDPTEEIHGSVAGGEDAASLRIDLERALAKLSPEHRTVIVLRAFHGLEYDEIAEVLDIPIGTVRSRLHHARMQLRMHLSGERGDS